MLFRVRRLQAGDKVLIHAAAGGVGTAVLQLCQTVEDVTVFGTASREKHDYLKQQGCHHPIDHSGDDYVAAVRQLAPRGLDLVCDARGAADWSHGYSLLAPAGMLICFGLANAQLPGKRSLLHVGGQLFKVPRFSPLKLMSDNRSVAGVDLGSMWEHPYLLNEGLEQVVALFVAGKLRPHIHQVFSFDDAADAHRALEGGHSVGKILLVP
jgi:NADPH:quinone reductase-like Zn-dependent oxidoreductase